MQSSRPARIPYPDTIAPTKVAADSFNCLRLYPARSITARPRGHGDTGQTMGVDRHRLAGRGADGLADDLLQPARAALHAFAHIVARNRRIERGAPSPAFSCPNLSRATRREAFS
jgi:hypothetical protein